MPFGFALWGDYSLYRVEDSPGLVDSKILAGELLYLRVNLEPGENRFVVRMSGK
jgi:hypothetical protein